MLYREEEEGVEVEEAVKEEEQIKKDINETIEDVLGVNEKEFEPPNTIEKLTSVVDEPQEPEMINMSDPLKYTYPEKEDT